MPESVQMTALPPPECPRCGRAECASMADYATDHYAESMCDGHAEDWRARAKALTADLDAKHARLVEVADKLATVRAERDEARAVLLGVEWGTRNHCPWCGEASRKAGGEGHAPDCRLAKAIGGSR